jgi:hypothetical protein
VFYNKPMIQTLLKNKTKTILILLVLIALFKVFFVLSFNDSDYEPDSFMHFLQLRTIFQDIPKFIPVGIEVWAKPLYSYPLSLLVMLFNIQYIIAINLVNILIFFIIGFLVYKIIDRLFDNIYLDILAVILVSFTLTAFKSSTSALTEPIFTLCLVAGYYFVMEKKYILSSLFFGLSILGRIEGLFFIGIYLLWLSVILFKDKKELIKHYFIALLPAFIWNFLGILYTGRLIYLFDRGYPTTPGIYGFGGWSHFPKSLLIQDTVVILLYLVGSFVLFKFLKKLNNYKELLLAWFITTGFTLSQIILWKLGQFGSAGLMRYLVSCMPFFVVIAILGFKYLKDNFRDYKKLFYIGATLGVIGITLIHTLGIIPNRRDYPIHEDTLIKTGEWVKLNRPNSKLAVHRPEVIYYARRDLRTVSIDYIGDLDNHRKGIYIWTIDWGEVFTGYNLEEMKQKATLVQEFDNWAYIFEI